MGIKDVPQHYVITCDCCGTQLTKDTRHRPSTWVALKVEQDALDYSGSAVADASVALLLCNKCGSSVVAAMNQSTRDLRTARKALGASHD